MILKQELRSFPCSPIACISCQISCFTTGSFYHYLFFQLLTPVILLWEYFRIHRHITDISNDDIPERYFPILIWRLLSFFNAWSHWDKTNLHMNWGYIFVYDSSVRCHSYRVDQKWEIICNIVWIRTVWTTSKIQIMLGCVEDRAIVLQ